MPERLSDYASLFSAITTPLPRRKPMIAAIAGPPAAGKSTLAKKLVLDLNSVGLSTCYCPMDGFHLTNAQLDANGLRSVKGRIDTFNASAFANSVARLAAREEFWWPRYSRRRHEPIPEGIRIKGTEAACVIEGNFVLVDELPWNTAAKSYALRIFSDAPDAKLRKFLLLRHMRGGKSESEALEKIRQTDMPNARKIRKTAASADILFAENAYA